MSAPGRIVNVGFGGGDDDGDGWGVIEDRNNGHSAIALESVLSSTGRYVSLVYWPEVWTETLEGGFGRTAVGDTGGGALACDEFDKY